MNTDCFISYASADFAIAEALHKRLEGAGFTVWFDRARLTPGCDWHAEIEHGLKSTRLVIPLLTPRWKLSKWTKFETYGAPACLPILAEASIEAVATPPLLRWQAIPLVPATASEVDWEKVFAAVRAKLAEPQPDELERLAHLPIRTCPNFVGREDQLNQLHEELHTNPTTVLTQGRVRAIAALGGIGKTTLAREYIERFWRLYPQIFWVDARLGYESQFAAVHDQIFPDRVNSDLKDADKARAALAALQSRDERLLVIDNAEDETTARPWIPKTGGSRTLITSRFGDWHGDIRAIHLYVLDPEPARQLLLRGTGREETAQPPEEIAACDQLAHDLGYLPLALEQAAAYIRRQGEKFTFSAYRRLYENDPAKRLSFHSPGSTDYPAPVFTTWAITIEKLSPTALELLHMSAYLADTPIPFDFWMAAGRLLETVPRGAADLEDRLRDALADLNAYCMARFDGEATQFHNLVQTVRRLNLSDEEQKAGWDAVSSTLLRYAPVEAQRSENWERWKVIQPHVRHLHRIGDQTHRTLPLDLLTGMALYCLSQGKYEEGLKFAEDAYRVDVEHGGFVSGASTANNVSVLLSGMGRNEEAADWLLKAQNAAMRDVGESHSLTLKFKANRAAQLLPVGKFAEADSILGLVIPELEKQSVITIEEIIGYKVHLARAKIGKGDYIDALRIAKECLAFAENRFGKDHPATLDCLVLLTQSARANGDASQAEEACRRALDGYKRVLGSEHPQTLQAVYELAQALQLKGNHAEAEPLFRQALAVQECVQGATHPGTLMSLHGLAATLAAKGCNDEAEQLFRRTIESREETIGADHIDTLVSAFSLAVLLESKGDHATAEPLFRKALDGLLKISEATGHRHKHLILFAGTFMICLQKQGQNIEDIRNVVKAMLHQYGLSDDYIAAEAALRQKAREKEQNFGPSHAETIAALNELAKHLESIDAFDEAEAEYRKALERAPNDMVVLGNYAFFLQNFRRNFPGARETYLRALQADPADAINHTNYAGLCLVMDVPTEAESHVREAWRLVAGTADRYTARTLFLRAALATMRGEAPSLYLGQLKTLFDQGIQPMPSRNLSVRDHLRNHLPADASNLMEAIYAAINEPDGLANLNALPTWQSIAPVPIDAPWPERTT